MWTVLRCTDDICHTDLRKNSGSEKLFKKSKHPMVENRKFPKTPFLVEFWNPGDTRRLRATTDTPSLLCEFSLGGGGWAAIGSHLGFWYRAFVHLLSFFHFYDCNRPVPVCICFFISVFSKHCKFKVLNRLVHFLPFVAFCISLFSKQCEFKVLNR